METLLILIERTYTDTAYSVEVFASEADMKANITLDSGIVRTDDMAEAVDYARTIARHKLAEIERNNRNEHVLAE